MTTTFRKRWSVSYSVTSIPLKLYALLLLKYFCMQDNKGWNNNILKWASSLISGDASSKNKADKITVSNYFPAI
jgi:hypothetical protein